MSQPKIKNLNKLHLLGFSLVLLFLLGLTAYQLFVGPDLKRLPLSRFFKLQTLKQLFHQPIDLGQPQNFPDPNTLTLTCQPTCVFEYNDLLIPAMIDNDPQAIITDVQLKFFDPQAGLIGYQNIDLDNPTLFVLDFSGRLLQTIRLNLNQYRLLEFINYYPQVKKILFQSTHQTTNQVEHWLYSAIEPSLESYQP